MAQNTAASLPYPLCSVPQKKGGKFHMITYKEFSSLEKDLGFSTRTLYTAANHMHRHYHSVRIPKGNGEYRQLYVPSEALKMLQRCINTRLLSLEEISPYATAYKAGGSTKMNAKLHIGKPVLLKLDIKHFFDNIGYNLLKENVFTEKRYSEQIRSLLSILCLYMGALPQGAPTSPTISNIIMRDFDNTVGEWCREKGIAYTRYCDDMTFSGDFEPQEVIKLVKRELKKLDLSLNKKKTVVVRKGQKQTVTGIVVNEKLSIPNSYKKQIRQEMYYCMKFGVVSHLEKANIPETPETYIPKLLGRINYVLSIEPNNADMKKYRAWLMENE